MEAVGARRGGWAGPGVSCASSRHESSSSRRGRFVGSSSCTHVEPAPRQKRVEHRRLAPRSDIGRREANAGQSSKMPERSQGGRGETRDTESRQEA